MRPVISAELYILDLILVQNAVEVNLDRLGSGALERRICENSAVRTGNPLGVLRIFFVTHVHIHLYRGTVVLGQCNRNPHLMDGNPSADFEFDGVPFGHRCEGLQALPNHTVWLRFAFHVFNIGVGAGQMQRVRQGPQHRVNLHANKVRHHYGLFLRALADNQADSVAVF